MKGIKNVDGSATSDGNQKSRPPEPIRNFGVIREQKKKDDELKEKASIKAIESHVPYSDERIHPESEAQKFAKSCSSYRGLFTPHLQPHEPSQQQLRASSQVVTTTAAISNVAQTLNTSPPLTTVTSRGDVCGAICPIVI